MLTVLKSKKSIIEHYENKNLNDIEKLKDLHKKEIIKLELKHKTEMQEEKLKLESTHRSKILEIESEHAKQFKQERSDNDRLLTIERNKVLNRLSQLEKDSKSIESEKRELSELRKFLSIMFIKFNVLKHGLKERKKEIDFEHANTIRIIDEVENLELAFKSGKVKTNDYDGVQIPHISVKTSEDI
ncbi:MAG: hypothetical protein BV456_13355 [Thermoplasmata archaeon M8B2D]|nr:MAG: hypothetical protein BV456_13355 [Thermoplasmata archaeon M8B2D]